MEAERRLLIEIDDIPDYLSWLRFKGINISYADNESYELFLEERDEMHLRIESQWQARIKSRNTELIEEMSRVTKTRKKIALALIAILAGSGLTLETVNIFVQKTQVTAKAP